MEQIKPGSTQPRGKKKPVVMESYIRDTTLGLVKTSSVLKPAQRAQRERKGPLDYSLLALS
jgi:hypothetical protein